MKPIIKKRSARKERERQVLFGLVELFIYSGKPVGSHTLQESGFKDLSSATIRNYFASLEKEGFLKQQHTSSGRVPTFKAYQEYARFHLSSTSFDEKLIPLFKEIKEQKSREISSLLQKATESFSEAINLGVFLSAPRFDHDFLIDIKLVGIDQTRLLCVLVTDFGLIKTEILHTHTKLSSFSLKRIENYFHFRLTGKDKPTDLSEEEMVLAQKFYNEAILRYVVGYSNFNEEDIYRTGFSKLLSYKELQDAIPLASCLSLFESPQSMRLLLKEAQKTNSLRLWIGDKLLPFMTGTPEACVIATPYFIHQKPVGAIGILGPVRIPYKDLIGAVKAFSKAISECLTSNIYKFKLTYREPKTQNIYLEQEEKMLVEHQSGDTK